MGNGPGWVLVLAGPGVPTTQVPPPCTPHPVPPSPTTLAAHHPAHPHHRAGYTTDVGPRPTAARQAHTVKMEILSKEARPDTVSRRQERPAPDTVTTSKKREMYTGFNIQE